MKKMVESYSKLVRAVRTLNFKDGIELTKKIHADNLMLYEYGKAYKDSYLKVANEDNALFVLDRCFLVDGGVAIIKSLSHRCMKIVFVWFDELYERRIDIELFWWFGDCEDESMFCVRFMK